MTTSPDGGDPGPEEEHAGNVVPLHRPAPVPPPGTGEPPGHGAAVQPDGTRLPIVPVHLRGWDNLRTTLACFAGLHWHKSRYHGIRTPKYAATAAWWAACGARIRARQLRRWCQWADGWHLESQAVAAGRAGHNDAMRAHVEGKKTRTARTQIVAVYTVLAAAALVATWLLAPWWVWPILGAAIMRPLIKTGRPPGKPLIPPAVVSAAYQPPTPAIITRALGSLGIGKIDQVLKDGGPGLTFISDVHRDGDGWAADLDLPYGVTARMILAKRAEFASALRRPLSAVWPEGVPHEHPGRLFIWIGRQDLAKTKPRPYPLARSGQADIFQPVPFAATPRGAPVDAPLFEVNWLIGAAPGQGKTSAVRVLACDVALDPVADLWVHELAGKGDLKPLGQVCHRYCSGLDDESIAYAAESVRLLRAELRHRQNRFKKLPEEARPDGKLTRELAADRRLRPIVAVFDEYQNLHMHPGFGKQASADLADVIRLGRAYGIIAVISTQRPASECVPTSITGIVTARFCLKVPDQPANDMVLGTSSYRAGYDATAFRTKTDAGLGWLKGEGDPQAVRTYYLDLPATARIAARARAMREAAGVLSGFALGDDEGGQPVRSFAADVLTVFGGDAKLWCETIAARLREQLPGGYADITQDAVSSQLRNLGVDVKDVREPGQGPRKGCERAAVEAVAGVRELAGV